MTIRADRQTEAGKLVEAHRRALGLTPQDFCDLVSKQKTRWGRVNLDRTGLWKIENQGVVPLEPRQWAIAMTLEMAPGQIWTTPGHRMVDAIFNTYQKAAA